MNQFKTLNEEPLLLSGRDGKCCNIHLLSNTKTRSAFNINDDVSKKEVVDLLIVCNPPSSSKAAVTLPTTTITIDDDQSNNGDVSLFSIDKLSIMIEEDLRLSTLDCWLSKPINKNNGTKVLVWEPAQQQTLSDTYDSFVAIMAIETLFNAIIAMSKQNHCHNNIMLMMPDNNVDVMSPTSRNFTTNHHQRRRRQKNNVEILKAILDGTQKWIRRGLDIHKLMIVLPTINITTEEETLLVEVFRTQSSKLLADSKTTTMPCCISLHPQRRNLQGYEDGKQKEDLTDEDDEKEGRIYIRADGKPVRILRASKNSFLSDGKGYIRTQRPSHQDSSNNNSRKPSNRSPSDFSDGSSIIPGRNTTGDDNSSHFTTSSSSSSSSRRKSNINGRNDQGNWRGSKKKIMRQQQQVRCCICQNMVDMRGFARPQLRKPDSSENAECRSCVWKGLSRVDEVAEIATQPPDCERKVRSLVGGNNDRLPGTAKNSRQELMIPATVTCGDMLHREDGKDQSDDNDDRGKIYIRADGKKVQMISEKTTETPCHQEHEIYSQHDRKKFCSVKKSSKNEPHYNGDVNDLSVPNKNEKDTDSLILTDHHYEDGQEGLEREEREWEKSVEKDNQEAIKKIRRHMPVEIRVISEAALATNPTPNDKFLPKEIAKRFKRINVLQLLRIHPDEIFHMHPSTIENLRIVGMTLTERRALYQHLKEVGPRWKAAIQSDKTAERKLKWYSMLKSCFKENLDAYQRHVDEYGPPGNHPYAKTRKNPHAGCPCLAKQCPLRADSVVGYGGDYGYPEGPEYFRTATKKSKDCGCHDYQESKSGQLVKEKRANERCGALKKHYKGKLLQVSKANGSCEQMDEMMDKIEFGMAKLLEEMIAMGDNKSMLTNSDNKKAVASFADVINSCKLSTLDLCGRSGMQLSGKKIVPSNKPDPRSAVECSLAEEVYEMFDVLEMFVINRMKQMAIFDHRVKSTVQLLAELLSGLHERNLDTLTNLGTDRLAPSRRPIKTPDQMEKEVKNKIDAMIKKEEAAIEKDDDDDDFIIVEEIISSREQWEELATLTDVHTDDDYGEEENGDIVLVTTCDVPSV